MKRYLKNLLSAICGNNPYRLELDELKEQMKKADENVGMLQDAYYGVQEKMVEAKKLLAGYEKQMKSYQTLVENYRERIKEYQQRIEKYNVTIDEIQNES